MANRLGARGALNVGKPMLLDSMSADGRWYIAFEDNGETGYFYAADRSGEAMEIRGALHIYDVRNHADGDAASTVDIVWSSNDEVVGLAIDDVPQAAFDLVHGRGTCLTGSGAGEFVSRSPAWDESILSPLYE